MKRIKLTPRKDWQQKVEALGFHYHTIDGTYWDESVAYEFSASQIDELERVTNELHQMCIQAAEYMLSNSDDPDILQKMAISPYAERLIRESWDRDDFFVFGRFDLCYDGKNPPKMFEYNADTPTSLFEASVVQWDWMQEVIKKDQFNSIHEKLIERWKQLSPRKIHFTCVSNHAEDLGNTLYMMDVAIQSGHIDSEHIFLEKIGWNGQCFTDIYEKPIDHLYKLYPWEWLAHEEFGEFVPRLETVIEPAWKMLWSNKGLLPVLWRLFPNHPNLLESYFREEKEGGKSFVVKPIYGREGANIEIPGIDKQEGDYGEDGYIIQKTCLLPEFDGVYPVIGSWTVDGEACGIGIREDSSPITKDTSRFVPHYFVP
jgi:glutathionylspermidine synthase